MKYIDKNNSLPKIKSVDGDGGHEGTEHIVTVEKVKGPRVQQFEGTNGIIEMTEGNYVVTHPDGHIEGVAGEDFDKRFKKLAAKKK